MEIPQEPIEHIIDLIHKSFGSKPLMICSLVCKRFTARAQRHLFELLTIEVPLDTLKKFTRFLDEDPSVWSQHVHPRHFIRTLRLVPALAAIKSRQSLDVHQLMIILSKIPALHTLIIFSVRLDTSYMGTQPSLPRLSLTAQGLPVQRGIPRR